MEMQSHIQHQRSQDRFTAILLQSIDTSEESADENTRQYEQDSSDHQHIQQSDKEHSTTCKDDRRFVPDAGTSNRNDSSMLEPAKIRTHTNLKVGQIIKYLPVESEECKYAEVVSCSGKCNCW